MPRAASLSLAQLSAQEEESCLLPGSPAHAQLTRHLSLPSEAGGVWGAAPPAQLFADAGYSPFAAAGSSLYAAAALAPPTPAQPTQLGFLQVAAQHEAQRQLSLLQQLKERMAAAACQAASSLGSSPHGAPLRKQVQQPQQEAGVGPLLLEANAPGPGLLQLDCCGGFAPLCDEEPCLLDLESVKSLLTDDCSTYHMG